MHAPQGPSRPAGNSGYWARVAAVLALCLCCGPPAPERLLVYCAASLRPPVEQAARRFEAESGARVELLFGGSNTLLAQARVSRRGDLLLPAEANYVDDAETAGLCADGVPVASMRPVLLLGPGAPDQVEKLAGLAPADARIALANPDAAAIGRTTRAALGDAWPAFLRHVQERGVVTATVTEAATAVALGAADAAPVWDVVARQHAGLRVTTPHEFVGRSADVEVAVLNFSAPGTRQRGLAERFAAWLASPRGVELFAEHGFSPPPAVTP